MKLLNKLGYINHHGRIDWTEVRIDLAIFILGGLLVWGWISWV